MNNKIINFAWDAQVIADLPLGLVTRAAPYCKRLVELQFQVGATTAARCVELLREAPVKQLGLKGRYVESRDGRDGDTWAKIWI